MNTTNIFLSIIMPVYNSEQFLKIAIESILNQTHTNFEFIIINDASTDNSENIILKFSDERIKYFKNIVNIGVAETLNIGIQLAKSEYIARMDSDDIALPIKFETQIKQFKYNANLVLCGTNYTIFNKKELIVKNIKLPEHNDDIKLSLLFENTICHPSVIFKKKIWLNNNKYNKLDINSEDYGLWTRSILDGDYYNVQEELLKYRIHDSNISRTHFKRSQVAFKFIQYNYFKSLIIANSINIRRKYNSKREIVNFFNSQHKITILNGLNYLPKEHSFKYLIEELDQIYPLFYFKNLTMWSKFSIISKKNMRFLQIGLINFRNKYF